ncbi:MAG TPA: hypothetical protein VJA25_04370 [Dehalococcoidia bacterium]|nr:hypothetical protein [Dehalococcoidia bacterium]
MHVDPRPHLPETPRALTQNLLQRFYNPGSGLVLALSGLLFLLGIAGFAMRLSGGFEDRAAWGFYAATFVFLLSTAQAAPCLAVATRLSQGYWRKPIVRAAELFTAVGVLNLLLLLPLLALIPPLEGRRTFWMAWAGAPQTIPQAVLLLGMLGLVVCGLGLLYTSALPDIAAARDHASSGTRRSLLTALAGSWVGTAHQWKIVRTGVTYFGIFYLIILVGVNFLVSVEYAITLVPGWRDPIFPAYQAVSSFQAGLATVIICVGALRAFGGYRQYLALDQFWNPAKILLPLTLLWFYFWWCSFIIFWYGRTPAEVGVLQVIMFGPYRTVFILGFLCSFVIPLLLLIWNPIRTSIKGPIIVSVFILIGNFLDRVRIYAASFSTDPFGQRVEQVPATNFPDLADVLLLIGAVGAVVFLYSLASRLIPPLSLWELKEGQLLTRVRSLIRNQVMVIGKPE